MSDGGFEDTMQSVRRIVTTGAVAAALLLVGAVILLALNLLFQVSRFSPFGLWGVLAVLALAALVGAIAWARGPGVFRPGRAPRRTLATDVVFRAPPPVPVRQPRPAALGTTAGRLGAETAINRLIDDRRWDEALRRLAELEQSDPALKSFVAVKRRAIERRRKRA